VALRASAWAPRSSTCDAQGLGTTIKYLRRTTSAAANNGLGTTMKYLAN
jgi:3-deoxy-D-arabino-heptulosonate 7-phosphate (DAHP) synthase